LVLRAFTVLDVCVVVFPRGKSRLLIGVNCVNRIAQTRPPLLNSIPTAFSQRAFTVLDVFVACFPSGKFAAAVGVNRGIRIVKEIEISAKIQLVAVVPAPYQKLLLPFFR
jgi:hypothetical protein